MPGIVGLITNRRPADARHALEQMLTVVRHQPFYSAGCWADDQSGVYVGWTARKNSFADGMPLYNERKDVVLLFSGEEFPEPGTSSSLRAKGHTLSPLPCSHLVHGYEEDPDFPKGLNGRFHGVIADLSRGTVTLFNDRYGLHRLYYYEDHGTLYFAAEAKAILAVCPQVRSIDLRGLGEYVACGCTLGNRSLFRGISILPPASRWVLRKGALEQKGRYFSSAEWEQQEPISPEQYYQELREKFAENLPRYFGGQEPLAVSLTGGLDTRMIMAWQRAVPGSLPCYSFGSSYRDCQDVILARRVAAACQQPHEVIPVGQEFLSQFARYAERTVFLTDGCAGVGRSPDLYVNEKAREIASVRMTGNYGGEVLRGVCLFKPAQPTPGLFSPDFVLQVEKARQTFAELSDAHPLSRTMFPQVPWHHYGLLALEESQLALRTPFLDNDLVRTAFRAPQLSPGNEDVCFRLIADGNPALARIRTDFGLVGNNGTVGRAANSPFLEFTFKAEYAYDHGMPQWVAAVDHVFSRLHLERMFLGRHKFYHFRVWYRDALRAYVREMLLDHRTLSRPYVDGKKLENMVIGHLNGDHNYTAEIHKVLTLELIHRLLIEN